MNISPGCLSLLSPQPRGGTLYGTWTPRVSLAGILRVAVRASWRATQVRWSQQRHAARDGMTPTRLKQAEPAGEYAYLRLGGMGPWWRANRRNANLRCSRRCYLPSVQTPALPFYSAMMAKQARAFPVSLRDRLYISPAHLLIDNINVALTPRVANTSPTNHARPYLSRATALNLRGTATLAHAAISSEFWRKVCRTEYVR